MTGQPELDDVINRPDLWQFKQRVSVRLALEALSPEEVAKYVEHRWKVAGGKMPAPFSTAALALIAKRSSGIPRLVNGLCDNALMLAFADVATTVDTEHVETAARDLQLIPKAPPAPVVVMPPPAPAPPPSLPPTNGVRQPISVAAGKSKILAEVEELPDKRSLWGRWFRFSGNGKSGS